MLRFSSVLCGGLVAILACAAPTTTAPPAAQAAPGKTLLTFTLSSPAATGTITGQNVLVSVPTNTVLTKLVPQFTVSPGAVVTVSGQVQVSGVTSQDFTSSVVYRITASDQTSQDYSVQVVPAPSSAKAFTTFGFMSPSASGVISGTNIAVVVPSGTGLTALVAVFSTTGAQVQVGSVTQVSGTTSNDFTHPVTYKVTAADGSMQTYTVTVSVDTPTFTVSYDANGGAGSVPTDAKGYHTGETVVTQPGTSLSLSGSYFAGWTTSLTGPGQSFQAGTSYPVGSSNLTLFAVWIPATMSFSSSPSGIRVSSISGSGAVSIPAGVTDIAANTGAYSSTMTSVAIPATVRTVGKAAFTQCSKLTTITVDPANTAWRSDASGVLMSYDGTTVVAAPGKITGSYALPSTVKVVLDEAFYGCSLLSGVTIPAGVTTIGFQSFASTNLGSVNLPATVTSLGQSAFSASALQTYTVDSANPAYSSDGQSALYDKAQTTLIAVGVQSIKANTFTIPSTVTTIGPSAFSAFGILKTIVIPTSVTTIGNYAFMSSGLTSISLPSSVTTLGANAFGYCTKLATVTVAGLTPPTTPSYPLLFDMCTGLTSIHVPSASLAAYKAATGWSSYSTYLTSP